MQASHKILREAYSEILSKALSKERGAWPQDPMVQGQIFPHYEDEFYPPKTLCSTPWLPSNLWTRVWLPVCTCLQSTGA